MKSQLALTCILGLAICNSSLASAYSHTNPAIIHTSGIQEVDECSKRATESIEDLIESIISLSQEGISYETTLHPLIDLLFQVSEHVNSLMRRSLISK